MLTLSMNAEMAGSANIGMLPNTRADRGCALISTFCGNKTYIETVNIRF